MPMIVRIVMVLGLTMMALFLAASMALAFLGDTELVSDILDFRIEPTIPPNWSLLLLSLWFCIGIFGLGRAFWGVHQLLRRVVLQNFDLIARNIARVATGILIYWFAICVTLYVMPPLIMWNAPDFTWGMEDYIPFGDEIILFILGIALWAITGPLRRAHEVQTEVDHFL